MKFFVKDFSETVQTRIFIFSMQVDNDVLYRGIANQPFPSYSSLYLFDFLSFHTLNDEIFVKDFSETVQARVFILVCRSIMLYCTVGLQTSLLLLILPCIYLFPRFEKVGGILVYICPSFRPSFRPPVRPSVLP